MPMVVSRLNVPVLLISIFAMSCIIATLTARVVPHAPAWTAADGAAKLRLAFAPLADADDGYIARGNGFSLQLTGSTATLTLPSASGASQLRMSFVDARGDVRLTGTDPLAGVAHYYLGNDPRAWRRDVALHERVRYTALYDGIDAVFYGNEQRFEYDFIVAPGANPSVIALRFDGARSIRVDAAGDLLLETDSGTVRQLRPQLYQMHGARRTLIDGAYRLSAPNEVRFTVGAYDLSRALVIDPVLDYGTFLGGSGGDAATRVAADSSGNMTVIGYTFSPNLTSLTHGSGVSSGDPRHAFVGKYTASGALIYIAYLGGTSDDLATDVAVDADGNAYVVGETHSLDFPFYKGLPYSADVDAFLTVLNGNGTELIYSGFIGGSKYDVGHGVALGPNNLVYIAGETWSVDFPVTTANAFDTSCTNCGAVTNDGFLAIVDTIGNTLPYVTYYGGSGNDKTHGIAVNRKSGIAYLTGETNSTDLPMRNSYQPTLKGAFDAMLIAIDPNKSGDASLLYASYFGGSDEDYAEHIAITPGGLLYVVGGTQSGDLPVQGPYQKSLRGSSDAFVLKMNPAATGAASLLYATYFGGSGNDDASAVTVDRDDSAVFAGMTDSTDLPAKTALQNSLRGSSDGYVAKLTTAGSGLIFSSYLGGDADDAASGVAVDTTGNVYISGDSSSTNFPVAGTSAQGTNQGLADATLVRLTPIATGTSSSGSGSSGSPGGTTAAKSGGGALNLLFMVVIAIVLRRRIMAR